MQFPEYLLLVFQVHMPLAGADGRRDILDTDKMMRWQGGSIVTGVDDTAKDGFDGVPTGTPLFHLIGGRWLLVMLVFLGSRGWSNVSKVCRRARLKLLLV
jgi:hypothetical protein